MKFFFLVMLLVGAVTSSACRKRTTPAPAESQAKTEAAPAPAGGAAPSATGVAFAPEVVAAAMKPFEKDLDSKSSNDHLLKPLVESLICLRLLPVTLLETDLNQFERV